MNASQTNPHPAYKRVLMESSVSGWWGWYVAAWLAGLAVAGLIVIGGTIAKLLEDGGLTSTRLPLGHYLVVPIPESLVALRPIEQLIWLVGVGFTLAILQAIALWWFYRGIFDRARSINRQLHEQVLITTLRVAAREGITAQRNRTRTLIDQELPRVHQGLIARWRAVPRSIVLTVVCTLLALSVDIWLTLLAVISGLIVWRMYRAVDQAGRNRTEAFNVPLTRSRLVEAVYVAPLISRVRGDETPVLESGGPLARLMEASAVHDSQRSRAVPLVSAASALVVALLVLALGGNMLVDKTEISLPAALVLSLALIAAVTGATRVLKYWSRSAEFRESCELIYGYIDRGDQGAASERMGLSGRQHPIELSDVRLLDGAGRSLLEGVSLKLEPATVVAFLGTDPIAVNSLAELLLGFGTPQSGRVTIGDSPLGELHERWLCKNVMWIGRNGPVWAGSITENLGSSGSIPDTGQLSEATRKAGVYDRLQSLTDGFATLVTPDDQRLDEATKYGLAIARAWIRKPAVVVVEEPPLAPGTLGEDQAMETLVELARGGSLVIVLPQRLRTLRMADRVILLNGGRLAGEGKHEELLATSDLYRHLNYVLFNPFRHMAPGSRQTAIA
jgi:ABC-type protease/lipase transport system fused ATPase/permease subunit